MKKLIIPILLSFTLLCTSCEPEQVSIGRKTYKAYFKKYLKDPSSFVVYSEQYEVIDRANVKWKLDYGAKNGYGAMGREDVEFTTCFQLINIHGSLINTEDFK